MERSVRLALISDIHANLEALEATYYDIAERAIDRIVCLGDIVGYNSDAAACIALIRGADCVCVAGNHDLAVCGRITTRKFSSAATRAVARTRQQLSADHLEFLGSLPLKANIGNRVIAVHGALHPETGCESVRLDNDKQRMQSFDALMTHPSGARICAFGHTHHAAVYKLRGNVVTMSTDDHVLLRDTSYYLINPGTIGEPRSATPRHLHDPRFRTPDSDDALRRLSSVSRLRRPPQTWTGVALWPARVGGSITRRRLTFDPIEIFRHPRDNAPERGEIARRDARLGFVGDGPRHRQQFAAQPLCLGGEENQHLAAVVVAAHAADQPGFLHAAQRDHRGRLHHADPRRELALRKPVGDPQHAQKIPLAPRDAERPDAPLQEALKGAVRVAHQISGT
jgi:predicted phosphodiesterase